ncbi:hypothetical protein D3C81_1794270 [compost metagenome]
MIRHRSELAFASGHPAFFQPSIHSFIEPVQYCESVVMSISTSLALIEQPPQRVSATNSNALRIAMISATCEVCLVCSTIPYRSILKSLSPLMNSRKDQEPTLLLNEKPPSVQISSFIVVVLIAKCICYCTTVRFNHQALFASTTH